MSTESLTKPMPRLQKTKSCRHQASTQNRPPRPRWSFLLCKKLSSVHEVMPKSHSFKALVKKGKFNDILARLQPTQGDECGSLADLKEWLYASSTQAKATVCLVELPLHILLQGQPPLTVVSALIQKLRQLQSSVPEAMCDALGRTPLHVACAFACHVTVVARLLNGASAQFRQPAAVQDASFAIPLHWACQAASAVAKPTDVDNLANMIGFLVQAFPVGLNCLNGAGLTPADILHAQTSLAPSIRKALLVSLVYSSHNTNDDDSILSNQQLSWIPNEVCFEDEDELDVSLLGLKGVGISKTHLTNVETTGCGLNGTYSTTDDSASTLQIFEALVVEKTRNGASVDLFEIYTVHESGVTPVPIQEDAPSSDFEVTDFTYVNWRPFESSGKMDCNNQTERVNNLHSIPVDVDGFFIPGREKVVRAESNLTSLVSTTHISSSSNFDLYDSISVSEVEEADEMFA